MTAERSGRYDVVVCGAGVAGLAAARGLGDLGLRVLLVDKQDRPRAVAKGEVLQPGALRVLRRWGTERLLEERGAVRLSRLAVRTADGASLMTLDYGRLPDGDRSLLAQDHLTVLESLAAGLADGVEVLRGVLVEGALRDASGRVCGVRLSQGGRVREEYCPLVVAADGIGSKLRRAAGVRVRRAEYPHRLVSFDIEGVRDAPADFSAYLTDRGLRLVYPLPGGRVRLYAQAAPQEVQGRPAGAWAPWCEEMLTGVPALGGLREPLLACAHRRQAFPVTRLLSPAVALPGLAFVGESAYAVHPMAAQGMNTAVVSAASLADRLAQAWDGSGRPSAAVVDAALEAYRRERADVLARTARTSDNAARMVTDLSWRGRIVGRRALRHTGANPRLRYAVTRAMSGLGGPPLTPLDRLQQIGLLPDPRSHRVPAL
ncbi:FAD-dependent oxidoreductase [Streptantibioticus silvisoli]|uniref:NAD(P)/FAD-dependent oxidoreductase n=1 Tax=Streptantibioticus silvisoli TaxID=2705255 RepID=A0ABT6W9C2_9ACTN|nr:NAD(P)/FAD-dependent oxidoreductase [Streptantibioticus silvisoli]MDI5967254.1 NAD(P)/FAD-dependent oxidoreductase [Streptantibioticus silvisoli]